MHVCVCVCACASYVMYPYNMRRSRRSPFYHQRLFISPRKTDQTRRPVAMTTPIEAAAGRTHTHTHGPTAYVILFRVYMYNVYICIYVCLCVKNKNDNRQRGSECCIFTQRAKDRVFYFILFFFFNGFIFISLHCTFPSIPSTPLTNA